MKDECNDPQDWVRGSPNTPVSGMSLQQLMGCSLPVHRRSPSPRVVPVTVIVVLLLLLLAAYLFGG